MDEFSHINLFANQKCLVIINSLQRTERKLGHWLGIYSELSHDKKYINVTFIDSFGLNPTAYNPILRNYLQKYSHKIKNLHFNTYPLQSPKSYVCGPFVCFIGTYLLKGLHLHEINKRFFKKRDRKYNDQIVVKFMRRNWPQKNCSIDFCPMQTYNGACFNCSC